MSAPEPAGKQKAAPAKTARRRSREFALQALYAWQIAHCSSREIVEQVKGYDGFERANAELAETLVRGVAERSAELEALIAPFLDRSFASLSPVERAILYIGTFELLDQPQTPFKVIVNEAIELGKSFGGTDGHKFVNGVLEKLAAKLRPAEFASGRRGAPRAAEPLG
ncbi:MAG: transcription antitermination factor NusB [Proteobacteria bacterium]|nr:transcription antitermination factor NusB [Pseudomonadota bacterium]